MQLRGLVYPKWSKKELPQQDKKTHDNNNNIDENRQLRRKYTWTIDNYAYSFSKHIHSPSNIRLKKPVKNNEYYKHLATCPFRQEKRLTERFKIFPS